MRRPLPPLHPPGMAGPLPLPLTGSIPTKAIIRRLMHPAPHCWIRSRPHRSLDMTAFLLYLYAESRCMPAPQPATASSTCRFNEKAAPTIRSSGAEPQGCAAADRPRRWLERRHLEGGVRIRARRRRRNHPWKTRSGRCSTCCASGPHLAPLLCLGHFPACSQPSGPQIRHHQRPPRRAS